MNNPFSKFCFKFNHIHSLTYYSHLHRECNSCKLREKRKPNWFFRGTNLVMFEKSWVEYNGTEQGFIDEVKKFIEMLKKCPVHRSMEEKTRFGLWAIYNETAIRQNRAFSSYGVAVIKNLKGETC